jgi:hypothetical protein
MSTRRGVIILVVAALTLAAAGAAFAALGSPSATSNGEPDPAAPTESPAAGQPSVTPADPYIRSDATSDADYWTPERMEEAQPYPMPQPHGSGEQPASSPDASAAGTVAPPDRDSAGTEPRSPDGSEPYPMPNPTAPDG